MNELVSIIMPSYNTGKYIKDSINSVLDQTYKKWELIIVDDCSSDDSEKIIKSFLGDKRIKYYKNEKNSGAAVSRNKALSLAKGKWIAFLDSDDIWDKNKLKKQLAFMKEKNISFSYTDYQIQLNGQWLPYICTAPNKITKHKINNYCYFSTITVMYDRDVIGDIQIKPIRKNNDYALWLKMIKITPAYRLPECLSYYIKHDGSVSSGSKYKLIKYFYILWRDVENKNKIVAGLYTFRNLFFGVIKKVRYKKKIKESKKYVIDK